MKINGNTNRGLRHHALLFRGCSLLRSSENSWIAGIYRISPPTHSPHTSFLSWRPSGTCPRDMPGCGSQAEQENSLRAVPPLSSLLRMPSVSARKSDRHGWSQRPLGSALACGLTVHRAAVRLSADVCVCVWCTTVRIQHCFYHSDFGICHAMSRIAVCYRLACVCV